MSTQTPLTDDQAFALIADKLEPAVTALGGKFSRAVDPFNVMELLGQGPGTFRVILMDDGEDKTGESEFPRVVVRRYKVTVSTNRGLPGMLGQPVNLGDPSTPSLLERAGAVRDALRSFTFPDGITGRALMYGGRTTVIYEGARLDAYELSFSLYAALPKA